MTYTRYRILWKLYLTYGIEDYYLQIQQGEDEGLEGEAVNITKRLELIHKKLTTKGVYQVNE